MNACVRDDLSTTLPTAVVRRSSPEHQNYCNDSWAYFNLHLSVLCRKKRCRLHTAPFPYVYYCIHMLNAIQYQKDLRLWASMDCLEAIYFWGPKGVPHQMWDCVGFNIHDSSLVN